MELWVEYLLRHKLDKYIETQRREIPTIRLPEIIVRPAQVVDWQVWVYFLTTHKRVIKICSPEISEMCSSWARAWVRGSTHSPMNEQKRILFTAMPHLETVWGKWTATMLRSNSSIPAITV